MVKVEWGVKRSCAGCTAKFYDLQKTPPVCPKCGSVYEMILAGRGRKSKTSALAAGKIDAIDDLVTDDIDLDVVIDSDAVDVLEDDEGADDLGISERELQDEDH